MRGSWRRILVLSVSVTAVASAAFSQGSRVETPLIFTGTAAAPEPPPQTGSWALHVISRGGFDERSSGDLTIRSDGSVTLVAPGPTAASLHPDTLASLNQRVRTIATPRWNVTSRLGICSDCVRTLIVLSVREPGGPVSTYTAFWDATTSANIPDDLRRLHDLARGAAVALHPE
jgi:hypothetical protein